ncbi:Epoxide hydrolase (EC [Amycolatopsis camponoti]|uniref:Epoxide hydrolase (EC) n=1 Tax=Amycolatopsis camponoti TaxID=2606593 RepID=A0A6I8LUJ2_9PSEU|nr:epoxide hydrolase family protein [Amycolatopsis camponoti]VVJ20403.1 Epoxide hydrolase (EC [Amycolatopsis camponoti]
MQPFRVSIPQADLDDLNARLAATRWPAELPGVGWGRGVPLDYLKDLAEYWRTGYDWRVAEAKLNSFPNFRTRIDGSDIHFVHVRSPHEDAIPLVLTHGWPGGVVEFVDLVEPLTRPAAGEQAFHLVVPSIPGYGFSTLEETGWDVPRIARAWAELMRRLGYDHYIAQGGDAGSVISLELGRIDPDHVLGVHVNMLMTFPSGDPADFADLDEVDQARLARLGQFDAELSGYMRVMAQRPQTLAYGLTDSPVGQLAWIVEKFREWTDAVLVPEDAVCRNHLLTIVSTYWLTASAGPSAQFYYEGAEGVRLAASGVRPPPLEVPVGVAVFPRDLFLPIRRWADRDIPTIKHWTEFDRGGHFAAMEQPGLLAGDISKFARSL